MNQPDQSETEKIEFRLKACVKKLHELTTHVGIARQVIEFSSDIRKNTLAKHQRRYIERGEGASNSEALARSDPLYLEQIKVDEKRVSDAYIIRAQWDATMAEWESCRSLLAMTRETMKTLEG